MRNGFVVAGPVGLHQNHIPGLKSLFYLRPAQRNALVHLAAQAPACGEIHKDRLPGCERAGHGLRRPRLPEARNLRGRQRLRGYSKLAGCNHADGNHRKQNQRRDRSRPAFGRPTAQEPSGNGQQQEARQKRGEHTGSISLRQNPGQPDHGDEDGHGDGLAQHFHPRAGFRQPARPGRLQSERDIRRSQPQRERRENGKGDRRRLTQRVAHSRSHKWRGAGRGHDHGQHAGEETARVALLLSQRTPSAGQREADLKLSGQR